MVLAKRDLPLFIDLLQESYQVVAPVYSPERDGIVLEVVLSPEQIATGYRDHQRPGHYSVQASSDGTLFGYANGPHSPKAYLHPGRLTLFTSEWSDGGLTLSVPPGPERPYAFFGIRPCDASGIQVLDRTFVHVANPDAHYRARREGSFLAVVNCTEPGEVCFCASMGTGPRVQSGYDVRITEMSWGLVLEPGSREGAAIVARLPARAATGAEVAEAERAVLAAIPKMGRTLDTHYLPQLLRSELEHPYWDTMKDWCVGCTNCTIVCPTCFCNDFEDHIDLSLTKARRDRIWDSCFSREFTAMGYTNPRDDLKYRYRHWLNHKLGYWVEQYGVFGCVGCGRCITWCPVGIDITHVATTIRGKGS